MSSKTGYIIAVVLGFISVLAQETYAAEKICQFCHEPSFLGASTGICKPWMRGGHPTGVVPSFRVVIPSTLPLDNKTGKLECNTCHVIKSTATSPTKIALRAANVNSSFCKACHNRQNFRQPQQQEIQLEEFDYLPEQITVLPAPPPTNWKKVANHQENMVLNRAPAAILKAGGKLGSTEDGQKLLICETCHRPHGAWTKRLLVMNNSKSQLCATCHPEQSATNWSKASLKGTHPLNVVPSKAVRARIKKSLIPQGGELSPKGGLSCLTCHQLHEAAPQTKLLLRGTTTTSLCPICHAEQASSIKGTKHNLSRTAAAEKNINGQPVKTSGICGACHLVHQGQGAKMWAKKLSPTTGDVISSLCFSCHSAGGCASKRQVGKYSHSVGVSILKAEGNSHQLPLFDKSGLSDPEGLVTCATCHNAHRWNPPQQGKRVGNFLRVAHTDSKLCAGCHKQMFLLAGTEHDPRQLIYKMYSTARGRSFNPQMGLCRGCHRAHNANAPMLWGRDLGPGEDAISKLCLSCHDFQRVAGKKQLAGYSHPIGVSIRNLGKNIHTPLPLFTQDYKRDSQGRLSCNTCHNTHQPNPMLEQPKEGSSTRFLRLVANDSNSTLCISCHQAKQLVKGSQHDLGVSAPQERNAQGQSVQQSGVCGACHAAHYNLEPRGLWNRKLGTGKDLVSQMCNSCHSGQAVAAEKQLKQFSHPININLSPGMEPQVLPTYNWKLKPIKQGRLLCSTCHDAHQRNGQHQEVGSGKEAGDSPKTSFLRIPAGTELCGECHPSQSLIEGTDHDLRVTAQVEQNWQGKSAEESGICGACHLVHGAPNQFLLWARKFGPSSIRGWRPKQPGQPASETNNLGIAVCTSCHIQGECAEAKLPMVALHPGGIFIPQKELLNIQEAPNNPLRFYFYGEFNIKLLMPKSPGVIKARFPVVDNNGRSSPMGNIVCITCHNVHQWSPHLDTPGPGQNTEGGESNSFLRSGIAADFCADCHSHQAIYLFSYYHQPNRGGIINTGIFPYKKFMADFTSSPLGSDLFTELIFRPGGNLPVKCPQCHNKNTSLTEHNVWGIVLTGVRTKIEYLGTKAFRENIRVKCSGFHTLLLEKYNSYLLNKDILPAEDKPEGVCFKCHALKDFEGLNPHQNQLKQDESLNTELCLLCHYEVPDPSEEKFKLVRPIETYCIGCHNKKIAAHPAEKNHFGQRLSPEALKQWQIDQQQGLFMPLQEDLIVCSTCHNTHQPGVLQNDKTRQGEANTHKLRATTDVLCSVCHQLPEEMLENMVEDIVAPQGYVID